MIHVGFGNYVPADRIVGVITPNSSPMRRLRSEARDDRRLVDATQGKRTRSVIITDSNHLILTTVLAETLAQRYTSASRERGPRTKAGGSWREED
jgi:regulator of extracellular matrix RemA (YlzA/DUF370 family)